MANKKKNPRYNVVSIRVNNEEMAILDAASRKGSTSISMLMREAIRMYTPQMKMAASAE